MGVQPRRILEPAEHGHRSWRERLASQAARKPVALIDWLLTDLQALRVRGVTQVPISFQRPLSDLLEQLRVSSGDLSHQDKLARPGSIDELMQALMATEATMSGRLD